VIALSIHSDRRFVTEMLKAGASGYLPKHCAFGELARAIREVMDERVYLSPKVAGGVVEDYMRHLNHASDSAFSVLAGRDREVLQLLAEGKSSKEIAKGLHLSVKTVEWYRREIMNKLGIHTMAGLIKYAIREGLTSPEA
jgi:DNA-binding NarL/FixJ family response regulator